MSRLLAIAFLLAACGAPPTPDGGARDAALTGCNDAVDCDDGRACNGAERCESSRCVYGEPIACDDGDPCTVDACGEPSGACVYEARDGDGDGVGDIACGGTDCDDADPDRYPGRLEICDVAGLDEDCDPATFGARDADGDGAIDAACCNGTACGDDCDDAHPGAHPTESEVCDTIDNDCDGAIDESVQGTFTVDLDGDGFGSSVASAERRSACRVPSGFASSATDCDDDDRYASPALAEICDEAGRDEDCDGAVNPADRCACTGTASRGCPLAGECARGTERCVSGSWSACTIVPEPEACDGLDEDCDGTIDEGLRIACWVDRDNDAYPAEDAAQVDSCPAAGRLSVGGCPPGRTDRDPATAPLDCDDRIGRIRPGATERLDGVDEDCDGSIDEGAT